MAVDCCDTNEKHRSPLKIETLKKNQERAPEDVKRIIEWMRNKSGIRVHSGKIENGPLVDYFRGKIAVRTLLSPSFSKLKGVNHPTNEQEAIQLLKDMQQYMFYQRVDRLGEKKPRPLAILDLPFEMEGYYAWFYEASQRWLYIGAAILAIGTLAIIMFPVWPQQLREATSYLSMGALCILGAFVALAAIRPVIYGITRIILHPGIWILPQLFADVGILESFQPLYEWNYPKEKKEKRSKKKEETVSNKKDSKKANKPKNESSSIKEE
eukprot:TRINITY_DN1705_c0_g1_i1.p1 TRINITY_DN1705_c0_g1~~TRINITY_DN1705_c0_g1_i1.p1  ORF type:complete len:268 (-),score=94.77 TRINITY_DN1705_c0_g1_i1:25-828(-)